MKMIARLVAASAALLALAAVASAQVGEVCSPCTVGECPQMFFFDDSSCSSQQSGWQPFPLNSSHPQCKPLWDTFWCSVLQAESEKLICAGCTPEQVSMVGRLPLCVDDCRSLYAQLSQCVGQAVDSSICDAPPFSSDPECVKPGPQDCYEGPLAPCAVDGCAGEFQLPAARCYQGSDRNPASFLPAFRAASDRLVCSGGVVPAAETGQAVCLTECLDAVAQVLLCAGTPLNASQLCPAWRLSNSTECWHAGPGPDCQAHDPVVAGCVMCGMGSCGYMVTPDQNTCARWKELQPSFGPPPSCLATVLDQTCRHQQGFSALALEDGDCGRGLPFSQCRADCLANAAAVSACWTNISAAENTTLYLACEGLPETACVGSVPAPAPPSAHVPAACLVCRAGTCGKSRLYAANCDSLDAFSGFLTDAFSLGSPGCLARYEHMMCAFYEAASQAALNGSCGALVPAPKMCIPDCERIALILSECGAPISALEAQFYCRQSNLTLAPDVGPCISPRFGDDDDDDDDGFEPEHGEVGECEPCPIGTCPSVFHFPPDVCQELASEAVPFPANTSIPAECRQLWDNYFCGVYQAVSERLVCSGCTEEQGHLVDREPLCYDECVRFWAEFSACAGYEFPAASCTLSPYSQHENCVTVGPQDCYQGPLEPCSIGSCPAEFTMPVPACNQANAYNALVPPGALRNQTCADGFNSYVCALFQARSDRYKCAGGVLTAEDKTRLPCRSDCVAAFQALAACLGNAFDPDAACPADEFSSDPLNCLPAGPGPACPAADPSQAGCVLCDLDECGTAVTPSSDTCALLRARSELQLSGLPAECAELGQEFECRYLQSFASDALEDLDCGRANKLALCYDSCVERVQALAACWPAGFHRQPPSPLVCEGLPTHACTGLADVSAVMEAKPAACDACFVASCRNGPFYADTPVTCDMFREAYAGFLLSDQVQLGTTTALKVYQSFMCGFYQSVGELNAAVNCDQRSPAHPQICLHECYMLVDMLVAAGAPVVASVARGVCGTSLLVSSDNSTCIHNAYPGGGGDDDDDDDDDYNDPFEVETGVGDCKRCPVGTCPRVFQFPTDVCHTLQRTWLPYPSGLPANCSGIWEEYYCDLYTAASQNLVCDGCKAGAAFGANPFADLRAGGRHSAPFCEDERDRMLQRLGRCVGHLVELPPEAQVEYSDSRACVLSGPQTCYYGAPVPCPISGCPSPAVPVRLPPHLCQFFRDGANVTGLPHGCAAPLKGYFCDLAQSATSHLQCTGNRLLGGHLPAPCQSECEQVFGQVYDCMHLNRSEQSSCSEMATQPNCLPRSRSTFCGAADPVQATCVICQVPGCGQVVTPSQDDCAALKDSVLRRLQGLPAGCASKGAELECRHLAALNLEALKAGDCGRGARTDWCAGDCARRADELAACAPQLNASLQAQCSDLLESSCTGVAAPWPEAAAAASAGCTECYVSFCPGGPVFLPGQAQCSALQQIYGAFPYELGNPACLAQYSEVLCSFLQGVSAASVSKRCVVTAIDDGLYRMCPDDCRAAVDMLMSCGASMTADQANSICTDPSVVSTTGVCTANAYVASHGGSSGDGGDGKPLNAGALAAIIIGCLGVLVLLGVLMVRMIKADTGDEPRGRASVNEMQPPLLDNYGDDDSAYTSLDH